MERFEWFDGFSKKGCADTHEEAMNDLQQHIIWPLCDAWDALSCDGGTTYFYQTEEEMNADRDGAYAPQITDQKLKRRQGK